MTWPMCSSIFLWDDARTLFCFYKVSTAVHKQRSHHFLRIWRVPSKLLFRREINRRVAVVGLVLPHLQSNDVCSAHCIDATVRHRAVGRGCAPGIQSLLA